MLGYPILGEELLADGNALMHVPTQGHAFTSWLDRFGGRWLAIMITNDEAQVHLDPAGSLSAVYSSEQHCVASTPSVIPYTASSQDDVALIEALGIPFSDAMYPLGLTPRHGVTRLLPNHVLDLETFAVHRCWPREPLSRRPDATAAIRDVVAVVEAGITALVHAMPTAVALTAGHDSRMLLACARRHARDLSLYTVAIPDGTADLDVHIASRIARHLGLEHQVVPWREPREQDLAEWMFRIGCGVGEQRGWRSCTSAKALDPGHVQMKGLIANYTRTVFWRPDDTATTRLTADRVLSRLGIPAADRTWDATQRWLDRVPSDNTLEVLDLLAIEQRLGCWGGVWPYAEHTGPGFIVFPFNHRRVLDALTQLPEGLRRSGAVPREIVGQTWPELLAFPINYQPNRRRVYRAIVRRARTLPRRFARGGAR